MLVAEVEGAPAGLLTYVQADEEWEVLTLHAVDQWRGAGTALLAAVANLARAAGARRLWLITTNDNVDALRFYQRRGLRIRAVRPGAIDDARRSLKPDIGERGEYGIPLRDEIELEIEL
jgi:ribosomal protein S18 acetylase RimI-like enzyme